MKTIKKKAKVTKTANKSTKKITGKTKFSDLMKDNHEAARKLSEMGLGCMGCPLAMSETLEQGAEAHGMNVKELIKELNKKQK